MLTVGVDIIEVERIQNSIDRYGIRFINRIFTIREQAYCTGRPERLAARFAVKEAVGKALGTGMGEIRWRDIEIINDERGRPELILHSAAAKMSDVMALQEWSISISHTATHAVGIAVALGR